MGTPAASLPAEAEEQEDREREEPAPVAEAAAETAAVEQHLPEPISSSHESVATAPTDLLKELAQAIRLQHGNLELLHQQNAHNWTDLIPPVLGDMGNVIEDLRACVELVTREIGRADELVERHGKATAAMIEVHDRLAGMLDRLDSLLSRHQ